MPPVVKLHLQKQWPQITPSLILLHGTRPNSIWNTAFNQSLVCVWNVEHGSQIYSFNCFPVVFASTYGIGINLVFALTRHQLGIRSD